IIAVIGSNLSPEPYPLGNVVQKSAFAVGATVAGERLAKGSPREGVGEGRMTGNAKRLVIACGPRPSHPPVGSLIEISSSGGPIPGARNLSVRSRTGGKSTGDKERRCAQHHQYSQIH